MIILMFGKIQAMGIYPTPVFFYLSVVEAYLIFMADRSHFPVMLVTQICRKMILIRK
jgi:hypothetical protein